MLKENHPLPIFEGGKIEHAYESDFLGYTDTCPRCKSKTVQNYAELVYATTGSSRVLTTPGCYFCPTCPTAIVDDTLNKKFVAENGFTYGGMLGFDLADGNMTILKTINDENAIYVIDHEDEIMAGLTASVHFIHDEDRIYIKPTKELNKPVITNTKSKNRAQNKEARKARKRNRKK
ncbi:MAG: hypothetical protein HC892_23150 [Saprospiraceae bacterium]|nr:hypothetical protein [Saprospiraceae bacterium]